MTNTEKMNYQKMETIAVYPLCNFGGLTVKAIEHGIDDYIVVSYDDNMDIHRVKINYTPTGKSFIRLRNCRYYIDDFMRVN